jgi:DNA-binding transcriptional MerR regulator
MPAKAAEPSSSRALRARLARAGIDVSEHQIERWHKAGLLPPPRRRSLGRKLGSTSSYPPGTVAQVRALLRLLDRHRNLDKVAALLKLNGYTVSARACRLSIEHLLLDPLESLDPHGTRRYTDPAAVATGAATRITSRRARTDQERNDKARDIALAGGEAAHTRLLASVLLPLFGGLDQANLVEALDKFGLGPVARKISAAVPGLAQTISEDVAAGRMQIDGIRADALPTLTADDYDTLVRVGQLLVAAIEGFGVAITPADPFVADCIDALRHPESTRRNRHQLTDRTNTT